MTEKLNEPEGTAANDEFERRLAELEQILEEFPSAPPSLPGEPRPHGLLAQFLAAHPIRH